MNESKLDLIRKLLAKAEKAGTEAEAETYNEKARELMARHGIDQALLAAAGKTQDEITQKLIPITGTYSQTKARLVGWIMAAMGGKAILHPRGKKIIGVTVFGFASDIERAELVFTSLLLQASNQLVHVRPDSTAFGDGDSTRAYRNSWFQAFAQTVANRIQDAEKRARNVVETTPEGTSTALVLVDRRDRVANAYQEAFPNLRSAARQKITSAQGAVDGLLAGERADIGAKRVGNTRKALR